MAISGPSVYQSTAPRHARRCNIDASIQIFPLRHPWQTPNPASASSAHTTPRPAISGSRESRLMRSRGAPEAPELTASNTHAAVGPCELTGGPGPRTASNAKRINPRRCYWRPPRRTRGELATAAKASWMLRVPSAARGSRPVWSDRSAGHPRALRAGQQVGRERDRCSAQCERQLEVAAGLASTRVFARRLQALGAGLATRGCLPDPRPRPALRR
jgi:hypothetical protein